MNLKTKKIIAREGIVILSITLLFIITLMLPNSIVLKDINRPIDLLTEAKLEIREKKTGIIYTVVVNKKDVEQNVEGYDISRAQAIQELANRGKFKDIDDLEIIKKELPFPKDATCIILFFIYPAWLLIRFIIWAIKALREKQ